IPVITCGKQIVLFVHDRRNASERSVARGMRLAHRYDTRDGLATLCDDNFGPDCRYRIEHLKALRPELSGRHDPLGHVYPLSLPPRCRTSLPAPRCSCLPGLSPFTGPSFLLAGSGNPASTSGWHLVPSGSPFISLPRPAAFAPLLSKQSSGTPFSLRAI